MIQGFELFFSLFNNLALFIALVCLYGFILVQCRAVPQNRRQMILGFVFGVFAVGCMYARIPVYEGVIVDQRNAVVALSGAFGGPLSVLITALMTGSYRVYLGGNGVLGGVIGVCLSAGAGLVLRRFPRAFSSAKQAAIGSVAATLIILPGFLFLKDLQTGWGLLKAMALPYGAAISSGIFLAGLLLNREEKKYEQELAFQKTRERLDLALSGANEGLWDWDLATNEVHFDPRYYTLSGYEPDEFPGTFEEWEKRVHPEDMPAVRKVLEDCMSGRLSEYNTEFRFLHKSGEYMWIQGKGKIVAFTPAGTPKRFIGTHSDITRRKEIERSLRITRFSFDTAAIGIYLIASDARILDVNPYAAQLLGYTTEEVKGMSVLDIDSSTPEDADWTELWQTLCRSKQVHFEREHLSKEGKIIPVEVTSSLFEYDNQQFALAFVKDIRRRKETETQLTGLRNYLASIIESMPSILICLDAGCRATLWNKRAERLMPDRSVTAGSNQPVDQVFPFLCPHMEEVRDSLKTKEMRQILKSSFERDTGTPGFADIIIFPLSADGIDGAVIRIDDISEKVRMETTLIQNEKMLSIGGLAAGMAHEINNPLAGVIQNAGVMSNRLTNQTIPANIQTAASLGISMASISQYMARRKIPDMIKAMNDACSRMAVIVDNMLNFARKSDSSFVPQDPAGLMDKVLELASTGYDLQKHYDFKAIRIEKDYEASLPFVDCEGGEIQQVILNILNNGAHAMFESPGPHAPEFVLRLAHEAAAGMLRIEIEDNGPGMDKVTCGKIFDPFFTTKPVGTGTGLGLSVSYFIITENHKGTMAVVSEPGCGSNFIIRIPVRRK